MSNKKRIAIIGGGSSGLCAAKYALANDFEPVVFEKSSYIGGVWSPTGLTWESMHTNVSHYLSSFGDFPWPKGALLFPNSTEVYKYLEEYMRKFNLEKFLRFNRTVVSVRMTHTADTDDKNCRWEVVSFNQTDSVTTTEIFDYCIIASGFNTRPVMPDYEDINNFKGKIYHASDYRSNDDRFKSKRVIIVGCAFSAIEMVTDLVGHASSVINLFRKPYMILPKIVREKCSSSENDDENGEDKYTAKPIDSYFFARHAAYDLFGKKDRDGLRKLFSRVCPLQTNEATTPSKAVYIDLNDETFSPRIAISEDYLNYLTESKIKAVRGEIKSFKENGVVLNDDSFLEADVVLFCTSHTLGLNFFDADTLSKLNFDTNIFLNPIILYEVTWHPDLHNLAFCGIFRGSNFFNAEMQSKWIFKVFKGEKQLPSREQMQKIIDDEAAKRRVNPLVQYPYPSVPLMDRIAREIDAYPDLESIRTSDPDLYNSLWNNPTMPVHYLLNDPTRKEAALDYIRHIGGLLKRKYTKKELDNLTVYNYC